MHVLQKIGLTILAMTILLSAVHAQDKQQLSVDEFETKLNQTPESQLVDVRTPEEFRKNHIKGAFNININSDEFEKQVAALDKTKPILVYCLSGGRSAKAAAYMRKQGFSKVYEMDGGMMQWTAQNKPFEASEKSLPGMSEADFGKNVDTDKIVLVDFYAKWCAPCKKMAPWLEELVTQYPDQVTLLKINVDENSVLVKKMKVDALPTLQLYKKGKKVWSKTGLAEKKELEEKIKENL
ncbi:thioredoxin [Ohtaekwangia kribbensis]|jgi:thioredoxin 1|uniref:Thioredoxin n=1 Tax=Ohtaekwangia kribbensis TaxID=688913 RepID=A0ABW3K120_9BACT